MNPNTNLRLRTLMRAMSEVVIPAIDPNNSLAQEQAQLILGHLNALLQHSDEKQLIERDTAANCALAQALLDSGNGGPETMQAKNMLAEALEVNDPNNLTHAIENFVVAIGHDGDPELHAASARLVMAHAQAQNHIGRAWFKPMGFDAQPDDLPDPNELFKESPSRD